MQQYRQRLTQLRTLLRAQSCDGAAIVVGPNLRYLTGLVLPAMERLTLLLLPTAQDHPPCLVVPVLELARVQAVVQSPDGNLLCEVASWSDTTGPTEAVAQAVATAFPASHNQKQPLTLAVEYLTMNVQALRALEGQTPTLRTIDATPLLGKLRMVKTANELMAMREAVRIIEASLDTALPQLRPGTTERQFAAVWRSAMLAAGSEGESFDCIVASGPNSAHPHHHNSDRAFEVGDLIILDGGVYYAGYTSDITRTVALGEPGPTARQIYELVLAANAAGRAAMRPGLSGAAIDAATRAVIVAGGYGEQFIHRTGHGLGLEPHELPNIVAGSDEPLPVGTTFTIEPGVYLAGVGGVRIEDDVVLTTDGGESLTSYERNLIVLPTT